MDPVIRKAKDLIRHQLEYSHNLPAIADQLKVNYHTLRKQFPRSEGVPMIAWYRRQRIDVAKRLLRNPELPIFQITKKLGFSANSNFTRWFKQHTGLPPRDYRRNYAKE